MFYNLDENRNNILKFKNYNHKNPVPFRIYADLESLAQKLHRKIMELEELRRRKESNESYQIKISKQKVSQYCIYVVSDHEKLFPSCKYQYRGEDALEKFCKQILELEAQLSYILWNPPFPDHNLTTEEEIIHERTRECFYCGRGFNLYNLDGVLEPKDKDHCHLSGKYRGAAHHTCNLNAKLSKTIPVIFHNLSHYDGKLIVKGFSYVCSDDIKPVAKSYEEYISFTIRSLKFIDSYRFLGCSLDVATEAMEDSDRIILRKEFPTEGYPDDKMFNLMKHKGICDYEKMEDHSYYEKTEFPPKDDFYSTLKGKGVSQTKYDRGLEIYKLKDCRNRGDYSDLYCLQDVINLADCFEKFRQVCLNSENYGIDPCYYMSTPGLTWDCGLKFMSEIKCLTCTERHKQKTCTDPSHNHKVVKQLELLTNYDMMLFVEEGKRGGLSGVMGTRHAIANNKYLSNYDNNK